MTLMPRGEHLDGTTAECAHLHLLLACFRASPPPMRLPGVTGARSRGTRAGIIDSKVFRTAYAVIYATSGRVISGDRRCNTRSGLVRGMVHHVATAVPASASTASRTWCGVVTM